MKAAQINDYGDASVLQINEVEVPTVSDGQVLVEVHASSLNPFDTSVRAGYMKQYIPLEFPATLGGDIAGIVTEIGADVTSVAVGDKVYGQAYVVAGNSGAFAEYAATKSTEVAKMPSNVDFNQAGSLPLAAVSALQAINHHIKLASGQKIFINGGAGAIGAVAIQIAKSIGAYVATTASGSAIDYVKQLGADEVIDYKSNDFTEILSDYDAVFDTVGGEGFVKTLAILKKGGVAVSMASGVDEAQAKELGVTAIGQSTKVRTELLDELTTLVEDGVVTPQIDTIFPLVDVEKAFELREAGNIRSKVVIQIK